MPVLPCLGGDGRGAHGVGWPAVSPPWGLSIKYGYRHLFRPGKFHGVQIWACCFRRVGFDVLVLALTFQVFAAITLHSVSLYIALHYIY